MNPQIERVANILAGSKNTVALTGAGISVESGIPPFRGKGGLWEKIDPMKYAHIETFLNDPADVWNVLIKEMKNVLDVARPNEGHLGLARLETLGILRTVITQNVDSLHQAAGSADVIEFHGSFARYWCMACRKPAETVSPDMTEIPPRCACSGVLRPDIVFFGEMIPPQALERSRLLSAACDVMLVIGTSAFVQPAAYLPMIAKQNGAVIVEINPEPTPLTRQVTDYPILGNAGEVMQQLVVAVEKTLA